jgi:hypothetical protein
MWLTGAPTQGTVGSAFAPVIRRHSIVTKG